MTVTNKQPDRQNQQNNSNSQRFYLTVDPILLAIIAISFATRYYNLEHPRSVVFDELHYIKFITLYGKRLFFFDPQPPFGKQILTLFANLIGFKGDLSYSRIGEPYKPEVPIQQLRLLPCIFGSLVAPLCYLMSMELGLRQTTAALVGLLIVIENSLLTQSRFILLDPILITLSLAAIYCYLRFARSPGNNNSTAWILFASIASTLAACTKYSGFYTYLLIIGLAIYTWWGQIESIDLRKFTRITALYSAYLFLVPVAIYVSIYYMHLSWLTKAGPHDSIMTSAFQASLEGGLASITRGQPLEIVHGSQVTLRHTHGRSCWLHSHEHLYPIKYPDGRGSSHQQQVTCYSFKDVNNWWIVKRPHVDELVVTEPFDKIKDGDYIQLIHGLTGRALNSHDVASAMSPYSQEVSCYVDHNISMPAQNLWKVQLTNPQATGGQWHTLNSQLQLIHLNSSLTLRFSGRQLPEWGFHQHEVVADKDLKNTDTVWNVEEHRYTKSEDQKEREVQFGEAEFVPLEPTSLSFLDKFYELHYKLFTYQHDAIKDHIYACDSPLDWIFMSRGTAYWVSDSVDDNAQIFLIGNTNSSRIGLVCIGLYVLGVLFYLARRRRHIFTDISEPDWNKLRFQSTVLISSYLSNLLPYFLYESPLFLQYYLSALVFKLIIIGAVIDHIYSLSINQYIAHSIAIGILSKSLDTFVKLAPLSYGSHLSNDDVNHLRWQDTWQLISVKG